MNYHQSYTLIRCFLIGGFVLLIHCAHQEPAINRDLDRIVFIPDHKADDIVPSEAKSNNIPAGEETRITMNFKSADLSNVLSIIASEFGVNLVLPPNIQGKVSIYLYQANLRQSLDMILAQVNYSYLQKENVYYILKNDTQVTQVYDLKYIEATTAIKALDGISKEAAITVNEATNAIVVTDVITNIKLFTDVIKSLDSFQPSVMIETEIFEVSLDNMTNIGVEWGMNDSEENVYETSITSPFNLSATNLFLNYKELDPTQIQFMLRALRTNVETHLLSSPKIVAMNGKEAKILVGERVPYVKASTATATGNVLQEVEFVDVGILLRVVPRIVLSEELVFLEIQPEVSEVLDKAVQGVPRIGTREANTRVMVKNGETTVIGGLIKQGDTNAEKSLPILGKIPIINWIFKNKENTNYKRELIVFITPHILTEEHYKRMGVVKDRYQRDFHEKLK
jgi:type IV pilus assembly protein PilQ